MTDRAELEALIGRLEKIRGVSNPVDIAIEIALFDPPVAVSANAAGTKLVYTLRSGKKETCWAREFTLTPEGRAWALKALRALKEQGETG